MALDRDHAEQFSRQLTRLTRYGKAFRGHTVSIKQDCHGSLVVQFHIRGNHEKTAEHKLCAGRFVWIKDYFGVKIGEQSIYLLHYAMRFGTSRITAPGTCTAIRTVRSLSFPIHDPLMSALIAGT
jgi:hypothetical protein